MIQRLTLNRPAGSRVDLLVRGLDCTDIVVRGFDCNDLEAAGVIHWLSRTDSCPTTPRSIPGSPRNLRLPATPRNIKGAQHASGAKLALRCKHRKCTNLHVPNISIVA